MSLDPRKHLIVRAKNASGERIIPPGKWWIDRNTERGEDADIYERKPHQGRKLIDRKNIKGQL